jgi:hypothetical protein
MPHEADWVDCLSWNMGSGELQVGGNDRWGCYGLGSMANAEFVVGASLQILESYGTLSLKIALVMSMKLYPRLPLNLPLFIAPRSWGCSSSDTSFQSFKCHLL